ncbi:hypothetical protein WA026_012362 [Henosepilachna vigintioctopunctata]|uniref:GIY-YIG domain-containing protein n=1 Tax=Henosepilachna vigintioctopunctata TaxID=420089 RepID=A0AAW1UWV4_9CUCU
MISNDSMPDMSFHSLPYIEKLTDKIVKVFKDFPHMKFAKRTVLPLRKYVFSKLKDPINPDHRSSVVYSIPCGSCDRVYVGQTSRWISSRIISHKSDCRRGLNTCSLAEHVKNEHHIINYEETEILFTENNYYKRLFLEMVAINNTNNTMNKKTDTRNLNNIYSFLLHCWTKRRMSR